MSRWFNIAGPCKADKHYMLSATARLPDVEQIIEQESYFVVHAPRQTGKTTAMLALAKQLTLSGRYTAVMVSAEVGSAFNHDVGVAEVALNTNALLQAFLVFWRQHGEPLLGSAAYHEIAPHIVLMAFLHRVVNGGGTLEREYAIGSDAQSATAKPNAWIYV